jgi:hypothetical protein
MIVVGVLIGAAGAGLAYWRWLNRPMASGDLDLEGLS